MMNLQELATVNLHQMPLKLVVMNNGGYAMIKQTQDQWLGSEYVASSSGVDLGFPNFKTIADAFGMDYQLIQSNDNEKK